MKKIILLITVISLAKITFTQNNQGKAMYLETIDMSEAIEESNKAMDSAAIDNARAAQMAGMKEKLNEFLKSFEKTEMELLFSPEETIYIEREKELTAEEVNNEQNMFMRWKPLQDIHYLNLSEKNQITSKDFMGKKFLIKQPQKEFQWKITGKQEIIAGFPSIQATFSDSASIIEAWFTPQIPVSSGPRGLSGLPGLVTKAMIKTIPKIDSSYTSDAKGRGGRMRQMMKTMNNTNNLTITLVSIDFYELSKSDIKVPKGGKEVASEEEYNEIIQEKIKEMQSQYGSGGRRQ